MPGLARLQAPRRREHRDELDRRGRRASGASRVVGFWETVFGESNELVYICAYDDLAHRQRAWSAFMADPEWLAARKASETNGPLVERVVNKIWRPTSFSPLQ